MTAKIISGGPMLVKNSLKFVDTEDLNSLKLGDEECVCFVKTDMSKYSINCMQEWIMILSVRMPNV